MVLFNIFWQIQIGIQIQIGLYLGWQKRENIITNIFGLKK